MWKGWFYFSREERRVMLLLLLVFIVTVVMVRMESSSVEPVRVDDNTRALTDSLTVKIRESGKRFKSNSFTAKRNYGHRDADTKVDGKGLAAGKEFADGKELVAGKAVYSKPWYINNKPGYVKQEKFPEGTIIDINTADTVTLKKIPGIGSVISRNIVRYRDRLGGFYSKDQLLEVRYADSTLLKWFETGKGVYRKLKVNEDGLEVLKNHPYMGYYRAKAITDYRTRRGKIKSLSQISLLKEFSGKDLERLKYYLDFE